MSACERLVGGGYISRCRSGEKLNSLEKRDQNGDA